MTSVDEEPPAEKKAVLVVDDEEQLRDLVRITLDFHGGFTIVGEAGDGGTALALAARLRPDVVVLDLGLPDLPGLHLLPELLRVSPASRVVVFSGLNGAGAKTAALAGGASAYVLKGSDSATLVRALGLDAGTGGDEAVTSFQAAVDSAAAARRFVRDFCLDRGCGDDLDSALSVVSELVANAVRHADSPCTVRLLLTRATLRVEVTDEWAEAPSPAVVSEESESGRGLFIVAALSTAWGVDRAEPGKTVWAELARTAPD